MDILEAIKNTESFIGRCHYNNGVWTQYIRPHSQELPEITDMNDSQLRKHLGPGKSDLITFVKSECKRISNCNPNNRWAYYAHGGWNCYTDNVVVDERSDGIKTDEEFIEWLLL